MKTKTQNENSHALTAVAWLAYSSCVWEDCASVDYGVKLTACSVASEIFSPFPRWQNIFPTSQFSIISFHLLTGRRSMMKLRYYTS